MEVRYDAAAFELIYLKTIGSVKGKKSNKLLQPRAKRPREASNTGKFAEETNASFVNYGEATALLCGCSKGCAHSPG